MFLPDFDFQALLAQMELILKYNVTVKFYESRVVNITTTPVINFLP